MTTNLLTPSDSINYDEIIIRIKDLYNTCSDLEKRQFIKILQELSDKGYSQTLEQLYLVDFKEVPVSIDRFLKDPHYLGNSNNNGGQIYPGWWDVYRDVFDNSKEVVEVALSGATRIGKSSTGVSMMAYMTYLLMCYRNPQQYFKLKDVSRLTIAFANLTKDLAAGVAFHEYQTTLKSSPWFNEHGTFTNSVNNYVYQPEGGKIDIIPASDSAHVLGMQLWACLVGDTEILTTDGYKKLSDVVDTHQSILQLDSDGNLVECNAPILLTKYTLETIKLTLADGSVIEGTPDHRVLLANGTYKALGELTIEDELYSVDPNHSDGGVNESE